MGYFTGNFCQGFSVLWWRTRHNEHHVVTNILEHDPDLENLPVLAWSKEDVDRAFKEWSPFWQRALSYQHIYLLPFLSLLHLIWAFQSILFTKNMFGSTNRYYSRMAKVEAVTLFFHWAWRLSFYWFFSSANFIEAILHFFITELVAGFGIAIVVFCNHYPLNKLDDSSTKCFAKFQILGTVNFEPGYLTDWFCGGLNYQIEHHLFPSMPRHNLYRVSGMVKQFCTRHQLPYRSPSFFKAITNTIGWLKSISSHLEKDRRKK
jgi:fatty acid desaturase